MTIYERVYFIQSLVFLIKDEHRAGGDEAMTKLGEDAFAEMDEDGNGRVTVTEYLNGFGKSEKAMTIAGLVFAGLVDVLTGGKIRRG